MTNPLNLIPSDPELVRHISERAETLAKETGHMVFMVVMKEGGKTQIVLEGRPDSGLLHDITESVPGFLELVARMIRLNEWAETWETKQ